MSNQTQLQNFANIGWKKMNVIDLINLCKTNSTMKTICDNPATWKYLIKRDFGLDTDDEQPQQVYIRRKIYELGLLYNDLANVFVSVLDKVKNTPNHYLKDQIPKYIDGIILNQQVALAALGLKNNYYKSIYSTSDPNTISKSINKVKVGPAFYNYFI